MFVQIGDRAFNPQLVTDVHFAERGIVIYFAVMDGNETSSMSFDAEDADAFRDWWENHAEVYRCS